MPTAAVSTNVFGYVLDQFDDTYEQKAVAMGSYVDPLMPEWNTERPTETYSYLESLPYMKRWDRGDARLMSGFKSVKWTVDTFDWSVGVSWNKNDNQDHQGRRNLQAKAQGAAGRTAALKIMILAQMAEGATNIDLLQAVPTAPDGAAPYATTAGGVDRFGVSGGNIYTGTGTSATQITDDFFGVQERILSFQDTENEPLWDPSLLMDGWTIMYPVALHKEMTAAFRQLRPAQAVTNVAGTENVGGAAVTNLVLDAGMPVTLFMNPHLTDATDWYVYANGSPIKPFFRGVQQALEGHIQDDSNSDEARKFKIHGVMFDARYSHGVGPMYQSAKVNN